MLRDAVPAFRSLRRAPAATLAALATITLAFAANVAIFSVVDGVLLRELPFDEPERLVRVLNHPESNPEISFEISYPELLEVQAAVSRGELPGLEAVGGYVSMVGNLNVRIDESLETLPGVAVSGNLFSVLGVEPIAGRPWVAADDVVGAEPVVAIGERLWRQVWGGDPALIDSYLEIAGQRHRVTTVLPSGFEVPTGAQMWIPLTSYLPSSLLESPQIRFFNPIARLARDTAPSAVISAWDTLVDATVDLQIAPSARSRVSTVPLGEDLHGSSRSTLLFLWGAAALVLLIACANLTNLQVVRALGRRRDTALRRALGASWLDVARLSLWESAAVAIGGSVLGTLLGGFAIRALLALSPTALYRADEVAIDLRVWIFALLLGTATTVVVGIAPLLASVSRQLADTLRDAGARSAGVGAARRGLRAFVIAQATLAVVLALGAALLVHSFTRLAAEDPGFDPERVLSFRMIQTDGESPDDAASDRAVETLVDRIAALPAVASAAGVLMRPLESLGGFDTVFTIEGRPPEESSGYPQLNYQASTPTYFETMGIPLLEGRLFEQTDDESHQQVAILSRAVARRFFPEESPLGRRFKWGGADATGPWIEIVGVVGDGRYRRMEELSLNVFVPHRQTIWPLNDLVVRSRSSDPAALADDVRREVLAAAIGIEATSLVTLDEIVHRSLAGPRFQTLLLGLFAALALVLGAVGLYGVMSYLLSIRRQEIGIRLAIGAAPRDIFRLALQEALGLALAGVVIGLTLAFLLARSLAGFLGETLHGMGAGDPLSIGVAVVTFLAAALVAGLPPALRARRVDPIVALRGL